MKLFYLILLLVLFQDIAGLKAQTDLRFEYLSEQDGLSHNRILSIHQDREGFIWFGTWEGLNKFDGYTFTVFQPDPNNALQTLSHNVISDIAEDKDGLLWLATRGGGLNLIDKRSGKVTTYLLDSTGAHYWNALVDIFEDSRGDLWISGAGGLARFDLRSRTFTRYPSPEEETMIVSVAEDPMGRLWAASTGKLYLFDQTTGKFTPFPLGFSSAVHFTALHIDKEGILWVGTNGEGLLRLDTRSRSPRLSPYNPGGLINKIITSTLGEIYEDSSGILWLATTSGLQRVDKKKDQVLTFQSDPHFSGSLSNNTVESVLVDNNGHLWVGTTNGINKWTDNTKAFRSYLIKPASQLFHLDENNITNLVEDEMGIIWLGNSGKTKDSKVPGGGLFRFYPKLNNIRDVNLNLNDTPGISKNQFFVPYQDQAGKMWVGTDEALLYLDKGTGKFLQYPTAVRVQAIAEGQSGKLWFGGSKGGYIFEGALACFDPETQTSTYYWYDSKNATGLNYHNISSITVSRTGDIWVATPGGGINRLNPESGKFTHYKPKYPFTTGSITDKDIRAIYEDTRGIIWVGTNQGGLNRFDPKTEKFVSYTVNEGLPSNHIESMVEDHRGNLWIGTSKGLSRLDPHAMEFRNYSTMDGLPGNIFNQGSKNMLNGNLFFGTTNGFVVFHPDSINDNINIPPVYITGLKVLEKSMPLRSDELELQHNENFLSLNYVALDYTAPGKNQYAYQLEGVDKNWVDAGIMRTANYTDLKPGNYTFHVKASNNDGIWNQKGATLSIIIHPPWWHTTWAYLLYSFLGMGLLYVFRQYTVNRERLKNDLKVKQIEAEKLHELEETRSRFFANISHEFRTPLTLILGPLEKLIGTSEENQNHPIYRMMERNARRLLHLINQLLDLSKLESGHLKLETKAGNINTFLQTLAASFTSLAESRNINFHTHYVQVDYMASFDRDKMEKIVVNLLSNAFKFTPDGGTIELLTAIKNDTAAAKNFKVLKIIVTDSGIGMEKAEVDKIFDRFYQVDSSQTREKEGTGIGLALTKELVDLHEGTITVMSEVGMGTTFTVCLPLNTHEKINQLSLSLTGQSNGNTNEILAEQWPTAWQISEDAASTRGENCTQEKPLLLIIEDNKELSGYIATHFHLHYQIMEAADGKQGLQKALNTIPDMIISDVMMPVMDGIELCKNLKTDERTSHIPVILLTAKAGERNKLEGLETGADDYLTKPFSGAELKTRVNNLIEGRKRLRERFSREVRLQPAEIAITSADEKFLERVMAILEDNYMEESFNLESFEKQAGLSRTQFYRKMKALTDQAPGEFLRNFRLQKAVMLLKGGHGNVTEAAYGVGFNSLAYFTRCFKEFYGQSPSEYIATHAVSGHLSDS